MDSYMGKLETTAGLLVLALTLATQAFAEEEYYTWVDENGVTNYAERNPQGYSARHITAEQRFGFREANQPEPATAAESESDEEIPPPGERDIDRQLVEEEKRINQELAAAKQTNCNIGRLNLKQLQNYNRIRMKDKDGEVRFLSEEEKQARIREAQTVIRENCN